MRDYKKAQPAWETPIGARPARGAPPIQGSDLGSDPEPDWADVTTLADQPLADCRAEKFCHLIVDGYLQYQAARLAGYGAYDRDTGKVVSNNRVLSATASRLLTLVNIQQRIREIRIRLSRRFRITAEQVLRPIAEVAFSDLGEVLDLHSDSPHRLVRISDLPSHVRRAIQYIEIKQIRSTGVNGATRIEESVVSFRLHPKVPALELLARHLCLLEPDSQQLATHFVFVLPETSPTVEAWTEQVHELRCRGKP